ncbi:MAG: site-specific integrase, partial [Caldithrix sp.]
MSSQWHHSIRVFKCYYLHTGCRRGEALNLTWKNIDLARRTIKITQTKGRRDCEIPVNDQLL